LILGRRRPEDQVAGGVSGGGRAATSIDGCSCRRWVHHWSAQWGCQL